MSEAVWLTPKPGVIVRDPETYQVLPAEGRIFRNGLSKYWKRRIKDGDVTTGKPPKPKTERKPEPKKDK